MSETRARGAVRWVLHSVTGIFYQKNHSYCLKYTYFSDVSYFTIGWILIYISDVTHVEVHGLVVVVVLCCHLVHSCRILSCVFVSKMNPLDVTALDLVVAHDSCWEGIVLCPNSDGCGEYNLLRQKSLQFRKTKCVVKEGELLVPSHSRQHTSGIRIPTQFAAVVGEWDNVRKQVSGWAWNGGSIIVAKKHQGPGRCNLLEKTMRCSRCVAYAPSFVMQKVSLR
jgi:hypothetical protein